MPVNTIEGDPTTEALDALRAAAPDPEVADDTGSEALDALRNMTPETPLQGEEDPLASLSVEIIPVAQLPQEAPPDQSEPIRDDPDEDDLLADLLGEEDGLEELLAETKPVVADMQAARDDDPEEIEDDPLAGLDDLLAGNMATPGGDPAMEMPMTGEQEAEDDPLAGLDDLLAAEEPAQEQGNDPATGAEPDDDPLDVLAELDDLLLEPDEPPETSVGFAPPGPETAPASGFGTISVPAPSPEALARPRFRMAFFGDFSGRAAAGKLEIGADLAARRAVRLDIDTFEEVIEGFATRLVLPIGPEGAGIEVKLGGLDDLHPDALVENCGLFDALNGLRQRLSVPSMADQALQEMQDWAGDFGLPVRPTRRQSAAAQVPADRRLSDFQKLIGDSAGRVAAPSPVDTLLGRIVGPHVVSGPDPAAATALHAVDEAMGSAMKLILHHPDFQAIEAQWRGLDFLARRIETDTALEITLYDISAEEIAADLAAGEELSKTGIYQLLTAPVETEGAIGFSAIFGLYSFEETPPHAELLGRMAQIASRVQAPFLAAMTPGFMEIAEKNRHPLTARAWDALRDLEAAAWLGLVSPRFLMRRPYGRKSDPIDTFEFEEFSEEEGLRGMLWANPVVLVATLLAAEWKAGGAKMTLGNTLSLGEMPYHFARDRHGDQIALPCTERNLTESRVRHVLSRGFMPAISIQGRDVVRLGSFQSLAGLEIAGPWSGPPAPRPSPPEIPSNDDETTAETAQEQAEPAPPEPADAVDDDLDSLLASFNEDDDPPDDPDAIDAELAALLEGL
ncbi:MAG: type VI secretion system contractile sheath domain-containing protein [Pseudorhodobacter sp.]